MPKIPQLNTPTGSRIQQSNLSVQRPQNISVRRATPTQVTSSGREILSPALHDISGALQELSQVFAEKEELTRVAKSQEIQMGINEVFRNMWVEDAKKTGGQTVGMLQTFAEQEDDLRNAVTPDDLDKKTTRELTEHFNQQFTRHAVKLTEHTIQQSVVADNTARALSVQDAKKNIFALPIGDTQGIDQEVANVLNAELLRHPGLTENQIDFSSKMLREDLVNYALSKWASDSPITTAAFWNQNKTYLKNALPNTYTEVAKRMEVVKENAAYDQALLLLSKMDASTAADIIIKDDKGVFGLSGKQRFRLSSLFQTRHKYEVAEETRKAQEKEDEFLLNSHTKFYDTETKTMNTPAALVATEQAYRDGVVDYQTYINRSNNLRMGVQLTPERSLELTRQINDREIDTKGGILRFLENTNASPLSFYSTLDRRKADDIKGFTHNYFNEAYKRYEKLAAVKKISGLPEEDKAIKEKDLLVDPLLLGDFKRDLESYARQMSYSAGDPRILKLADEMLKSAWYGGYDIQAVQSVPEGLYYGEAPFFTVGEEVGRAWELPGFAESVGLRTDTGGSLKVTGAESEKQWTADEQEAYKKLEEYGIPINETTMKQAVERVIHDRGSKE